MMGELLMPFILEMEDIGDDLSYTIVDRSPYIAANRVLQIDEARPKFIGQLAEVIFVRFVFCWVIREVSVHGPQCDVDEGRYPSLLCARENF